MSLSILLRKAWFSNMKSVIKKLAAGAVACLCMVSAMTGCYSEDKAWSAKRGDDTAPIGVYIYYLFSAYSEALGKVEDASKSVFDQEIDGKDGTQWVKDRAKESIQLMYYVDQKFEDMGLELDAEDESQISSLTSSAWSYSSSTFDQYGISQASLEKAYSQFLVKYQKIFEATYGKGGEKEVSDEDLRTFYEDKYTDFEYFTCSYTTTDEEGSSTAMSDEEKAEAKKQFEEYVTKIQNHDLTMSTAAEEYQKSIDSDSEVLQHQTLDLETEAYYFPDEVVEKLKSMKEGEVASVDLPDSNRFYVLQKNLISEKCDEVLEDEEQRLNVLATMKSDEFSDAMEEAAAALDDITYNDSAMGSYDPNMFFSEDDLVSSSESSESTSSESSSEE